MFELRTGQVFNKHHCKSGTLNYQEWIRNIICKKNRQTQNFLLLLTYTSIPVESAIILPFYCRFFVRCTFAIAPQIRSFALFLLHPYAQHCIPRLPISFSFSNLYLVCFRELSTSAENVPKKNANFYCWCAFCTLMSILTEGLKRFLFPISQPKFSPNPIFLVTALFKFFFFFFCWWIPVPLHRIQFSLSKN